MKEEMLFSNCSEATFRIDVNELSELEIKNLKKNLLKLMLETQSDGNVEISPNISLDALEKKFGEESYETAIFEDVIFGTKTLKVHGDFPYNNSGVLETFASENDLSFEFKDD